ncbi:MAG TPA: hypothetical protein VJO35_03145 [Terriglobales bacterium]|nr:hypothetical protein [Terriglobales bacterium]
MTPAPDLLHQWTDFYVIVGSSAGALTGLQFVVIALINETRAASSGLEIRAFGTPTVVHFCVSLLISAILCAPWHALSGIAICLGICGAGGVIYTVRVIRHARTQTGYSPDFGDWMWFVAQPFAGYLGVFVGAIVLLWHPVVGLFLVAAMALLLLFVGIHNAWDTVTYIAITRREKADN